MISLIFPTTVAPHHSQPRPAVTTDQFLDNTLRIVRMRGDKLEGRLNIFARRVNGSDADGNHGGDNVGKSSSEDEDSSKAGPV